MEFKREIWMNKLILKKHNRLIKVITGIRRCGKTYLLFTLFKAHLLSDGIPKDHIIEMSFDSFENKRFRDPEVLYPYIKSLITDSGMYYILFDEVQLLGEFEAVLNGLLRMGNVDVYVTGSNAKFLSKDIITEFRGRGDELHIGPLRFCEFMENYSAFAMPTAEKTEQEQRPLLRVGDNFKKSVVTKDAPAPWYTEEGVLVMSIYDFLLNAVTGMKKGVISSALHELEEDGYLLRSRTRPSNGRMGKSEWDIYEEPIVFKLTDTSNEAPEAEKATSDNPTAAPYRR